MAALFCSGLAGSDGVAADTAGLRFLFSPPHRGLMVRSAILWGLGNIGAQGVTHYSAQDKDEESISFRKKDKEFKINWYRVYKTTLFGSVACIGPAAYYRFSKRLPSSITTAEVVSSTPVDGLWGTINLALFFRLVGSVQRSAEQKKEDMKSALVLGRVVLPAALFTNWRFVPAPYQLHCASLFALVGSCSLSWIELQQHKDELAGPEDDGRSKVSSDCMLLS